MLTGRESLTRLVGKRRRLLPNRHSILSTPIQSSNDGITSTECAKESPEDETAVSRDEENGDEENGKGVAEVSTSDWVNCPVCGNKVRGTDYTINTHLDACLARGTKRKLTQRTLLQLFCSISKAKIQSSESDNSGSCVVQGVPDNNLVQNTVHKLPDIGAFEEKDSNQCRSPLKLEIMQTHVNGSTENPFSDDRINDKVDTPSLPPSNEMPKFDVAVTIDNISGAILETFIVGRKFSDEEEIHLGASISLLRDPDNIKDANAIKVLSSDSGCCKVLGFLPRELARYLSPLIEKYCLSFEGRVVSVPKHSLDVVPIQIVCQKVIYFHEKDYDDLQVFKSLWKNVLCVVESAKTYPPSMTKYQQNFCLLIQEVLRSNTHLLTEDEKIFLESFTSLSDDSQRLFVRLYTRKGPWFRMSNISYPEILNSQQAVKGLSATGYISSFGSIIEVRDDDMKEILNVLTVSELREISYMLEKALGSLSRQSNGPCFAMTRLWIQWLSILVLFRSGNVVVFLACFSDGSSIFVLLLRLQKCNRGTRKQDIISLLLSSYKDGLCPFLPSFIMDRTGICIRISTAAVSLIWRAERLFFLIGEQDLSAFLLVDLGIVKYPTYNCIISDQIFSGRSDLLAYEEAIEVAQIMDQSLDENNTDSVLRCITISDSRISCSSAKANQSSTSESVARLHSCFSASWVYSKVVLLGVSFLEREHRYSDAINLLKRLLIGFTCDGRRGYWMLRLSIDLEHVGRLNESLSVAEDGLLDPWVRAGSRMALQRRVLRLGKPPRRWKIPNYSKSIKRKITEVHVQGRPLNCETGMKSRFYGEDGEQCGVEQLALQYYAGEGGGWQGVHTESGIWLTIFGLLMWDIIFADVPNVFRTRFQTAPLDLETDSFYVVRKSQIESHLQKLYDGLGEEILITSWESHVGTACRGVDWDRHSLSELRAAVTCVGGPCLASICRHLAQDYRSWSSGMPDLLLWRFHGDYKGEAKLVEVKGPRDRLSEQQRAWLLFLMDCGFNTEVCKVGPAPMST